MNEIIRIEQTEALEITKTHYQVMTEFVKGQMKEGIDYGVIPHTNGKPTLLKPGAEKLCRLLNLRPTFKLINSMVDFEQPLFYYHYQCSLYHDSELVGQGEGNCNSLEHKYKKQSYKVFDLTNTLCKMAQKRALVAAVLCTVGASEFFTQDLEDLDLSPSQNKPPIRNITPNHHNHSNNGNGHKNDNGKSASDWYERGRHDAFNREQMKYPQVKPYVEGYESVF